jgi:cytochrome c oxidase cbb3-type subunit 3
LDNPAPVWFTTAFILCILWSVVYLWRMHITGSMPLMEQEFQTEMAKADIENEVRTRAQANTVDEKNIPVLNSAAIESGKGLFIAQCAVCHRADGGGNSGPNLTDEHWLHGGSLNDIFKSIKYGWPDKGMKSWKDDYSPMQLVQLANYIKSLKGTNPANPKEAQGEVYQDTATVPQDTTKIEK